MKGTIAIVSLLHERPGRPESASRLFRHEPVLKWTLRRLGRSKGLSNTVLLCWDDQADAVRAIANEAGAHVHCRGPRAPVPLLDAISASRRWADGWRGGLLGACHFDLGFDGPTVADLCRGMQIDAVVLVDPAAALVDADLIDGLVAHAADHGSAELCFSPAAPGLSGVLLRRALIERLAAGGSYPGRLLSYAPDLPGRDPIAGEGCASVPTPLARTLRSFSLNSSRQIDRMERDTLRLNGELADIDALGLLATVSADDGIDQVPREVVLELNTERATRPLYRPATHLRIGRPSLDLSAARELFRELAAGADDVRLTLTGVGDPLLAEHVFEIVDVARDAGIGAVHIETDLCGISPDAVERLAETMIDIVSVHVPAVTPETYRTVMGVDALADVIESMRRLLQARQQRPSGVPLVVPTFVKCRENLHEMEAWYDHWQRALGTAVISGPSDCGGKIPDAAVADMAPPRRGVCRRLESRLSVLCDGRVVSCEEDVLGLQAMGRVGRQSMREIWQSSLERLRSAHASGRWSEHPVCAGCREWHRP